MSLKKIKFVDFVLGLAYDGYCQDGGDRVILYTPKGGSRETFFRILAEVKGLEGAEWLPDVEGKPWACKHPSLSRRNQNALGLLTNGTFPGTKSNPFERLKLAGDPSVLDGLLSKYPYKHHQKEDIPVIITRKTVELAWDMGLGKTLAAMSVMEYFKASMTFAPGSTHSKKDEDNFWVIGPISALKAWESQVREWAPTAKPKLISNSPQAIRKAMTDAPHPPLVLVNDESANLKNNTTQRVKLILELSNKMAHYWADEQVIINMTGTPQPKDPSDWWSQIEILVPGFIRERSSSELRKRMAYMSEPQQGAHGSYRTVLGWNTKEIEALYRRLKPVVLIRLKKDCADLPDKIYIKRKLEVSPALAAAERLLMKTASTTIEALTKIRQLSDGFQYEHEERLSQDEMSAKRVRVGANRVHTPKDAVVVEYLEELRDNEENRVVIWAAYHEAVDRIAELCIANGWSVIRVDGRGWTGLPATADTGPSSGWTPEASQDQFQLRDLDKPLAFVANPESGGEGLTLTKASTAIYYSNTFRADKRRQSEDRIHRLGMDQNRSPRIIDLIHLSTDAWVLQNLKEKIDLEKLALGQMISTFDRMQLETAQ